MTSNEIASKRQAKGKWTWNGLFGFAVFGFYALFTGIAISRYPQRISPLNSYLSMLGNAELSPEGAIFYNLGVILSGMAEIPFYIATYAFYMKRVKKWFLHIGLLAGFINGLAVLMSGVNPLSLTGDISAHVTWSYIIFFSLIPALIVFNLILWGVKGLSKGISSYGFVVCAIDITFLVTLLSGHIGAGLGSVMEWFSVLSYLIWIALVSFFMVVNSCNKNKSLF